MTVEFRLLGDVGVRLDGRDLDAGHARQRSVLAALLVDVGRPVQADQLVDRVWADRPPYRARNALSAYLSRLRRVLADADGVRISREPGGYVLAADPLAVDLHRFRHLAGRARGAGDAAAAAALFDEALGLWSGEPLAGLDTPWAQGVRAAAEAEQLAVVLDRNDAALAAGRHAELLAGLAAALRAHPLDERLAGQLMLAQHRSGRQADALETHRQVRERLVDELGADPGPALRAVHQQILGGDPGSVAPLPPAPPPAPASRGPALPAPLTTFVGRAAERAALAALLGEHRMVTAVGPGGVGKTRLALAVAADVADRFADGVRFIDLVPVTDPAMVAPAVAAGLGLGEQQARSPGETVLGRLADRQCLLVLDNCEHVVDGVVELVEGLLAGAPGLVVLATSRARLQVPYEWVFPVPGLSVTADGDAVALFRARATAAGSPPDPADLARVAAVCDALDGTALAIELAAARLPAVGLDGVEAGLADRLQLLAGRARADDRHRSLRSALDWSYALLSGFDQALLRRTSVFASPFTVEAARAVAGDRPLPAVEDVRGGLARLVDQNLLSTAADPGGTRYRMLETIRQYGTGMLVEARERDATATRHLAWCQEAGEALAATAGTDPVAWGAAFDRLADDMRSALTWAATRSGHLGEAHRLAVVLADLTFARGMPGEAQRRYEQAAAWAGDDAAAAAALRSAAGAALSRHGGDDALALFRSAADAALRAADPAGAARDLAQAADVLNRFPGLLRTVPPDGAAEALLTEARPLARGNPAAEAQVLAAEAAVIPDLDPRSRALALRAIELARLVEDPVVESAALDQLATIQLAGGDIRGATESVLRRTQVLAPLPVRAEIGVELADAYHFATEAVLAAGDLAAARRLAAAARDLPFHREEGHLATSRLIVVTALAGDWDETVALAERFRDGWERAGRPAGGSHGVSAAAAAAVHGMRGDDTTRAAWLDLVRVLEIPKPGWRLAEQNFGAFFDAWLLLHRGRPAEAAALLRIPPEEFRTWFTVRWRPWYAALRAEAAVLSGQAGAAAVVATARAAAADNPVAAAVVDRAAALAAGDRPGLLAAAAALEPTGCRYQWARTLVLAGGPERDAGRAVLAAMGATPMAEAAAVTPASR
ncbi:putative ATPase [Pseudonocardia hierapolitana]|uniref:Putative ATPase n=1 Tax=Pseudonocardia hierapolitana TaxID=1128676 RepID=A0A561T3J2_9PSEU|nr:BTAD domain-containing putative transcriptional regulator [Pseudonocardia hierapolitana]TWF81680.1 putative ATPase [Pseudonocardia hierapolitana]